jgi:hypothetical protein
MIRIARSNEVGACRGVSEDARRHSPGTDLKSFGSESNKWANFFDSQASKNPADVSAA